MRLPESPKPLLAVSCLAGALLIPGLILTAGSCSSEPRPLPAPDCSAQEGVEFSPIDDLRNASNWFSSGDATGADFVVDAGQTQVCVDGVLQGDEPMAPMVDAGQIATASVAEAAVELDLCGMVGAQDNAVVLRSEFNHDWGSLFGNWQVAAEDRWIRATGWEGIAFWARSPGNSSKSFTVLLNTYQTEPLPARPAGRSPADDPVADKRDQCLRCCTEDFGGVVSDPSQSPQLIGDVPDPWCCGNSFRRVLTVTDRWQLYLLPFDSFWQERLPNLEPDGIDPSLINGVLFRADKEAKLDLWLVGFGLYRRP